VSDGGLPLSRAEVQVLDPRFTLATLAPHPVDELPEWTSLLLNGSQSAPIKPSGPESASVGTLAQPGSETPAALDDLGAGRFRYTFALQLPAGLDPGDTLRVGVWLRGATSPSLRTSSTLDFTPSGAAPDRRDLVLDDACNTCHGNLVLHGTRAGVNLCVTCHTWQNADPDTMDPAAMGTATAASDPNPLELGRLVHRIHRGKDLPTLYASTSLDPAPALSTGATLPLPYTVWRPGLARRNAPVPGRKFSVVGYRGAEVAYGWVANHLPMDPSLAGTAVAGGVLFPREMRDCAACHGGAPQASVITTAISRRVCAGCHPDVWFGAGAMTDPVHFAHAGGARPDDGECAGCHVAATASQPRVYAPIADVHVPPYRHPRHDRPVAEIVSVANVRPGQRPRVRFRLYDRVGPISPIFDPAGLDTAAAPSPVPRAMTSLAINIGPVAPGRNDHPIASGPEMLSTVTGPTYVADAGGVFTYDFATAIPTTAAGIWVVGMDGRRRRDPLPFYDPARDAFPWPYTGEAFFTSESFANPVVYVDTAVGSWVEGAATNVNFSRSAVVSQEKCERCHDRILLHGTLRNRIEYCQVCHTPNRTDWAQRPRPGGNVALGQTYDGIEERSIDLKVMIHRIHTGARTGASSLEAIAPFVMYGVGGLPYWFDEGRFPGDLRDCTLCHVGSSYGVDAVPAGAPPTVANETATIYHSGSRNHAASEPATLPIRASCTSCHASGATFAHAASHTVSGVEGCPSCHSKGNTSVDVVHGLAVATGVTSSFSSIVQGVLVPSCATSACHSGNPPPATPRLDASAAWSALVGVASLQAPGMSLVEPGAPERSYLLYKLQGDAASAGGSPTTPMPPAGALVGAADLAAIRAWISNGAPND
jgi:OmcA/MtrC family decaheme c-type cytochrome